MHCTANADASKMCAETATAAHRVAAAAAAAGKLCRADIGWHPRRSVRIFQHARSAIQLQSQSWKGQHVVCLIAPLDHTKRCVLCKSCPYGQFVIHVACRTQACDSVPGAGRTAG